MNTKPNINFILELQNATNYDDPLAWFKLQPDLKIQYESKGKKILIWGDPVKGSDLIHNVNSVWSPRSLLSYVKGHYYYLISDPDSRCIILGNSFFSILPIYYSISERKLTCSDKALLVKEKPNEKIISKLFFAETILFNYPLFNSSIIEDVLLLPSNSYLQINDNKIEVIKHTRIVDFFNLNPEPWQKSVNNLAHVFLEGVKQHLPETPYGCSLTGGFDGRTLIASSIYHKKDFTAYCFGNTESVDLRVARQLTAMARLPFLEILLDEDYIHNHSFEDGADFILNSSGTATFVRAHYIHAARVLSMQFSHILSGNFGSEVFRAAHIPGVLISPNLYNLFSAPDPEEGFKRIRDSIEYSILDKELADLIYVRLRDEIIKLPCYDKSYAGLPKNQMFYIYVFEEIFRKYFGAEILNQFNYVSNRTPFLDFDFLKDLFKTSLPGVHSKLFEINPFKRYKGQVLYAHVIQMAFPLFGRIMTDKGYKPEDLVKTFGKINILKGYYRKLRGNRSMVVDPNSVAAAWTLNRARWNGYPLPEFFIDRKKIAELKSRDLDIKVASLSFIMDHVRSEANGSCN